MRRLVALGLAVVSALHGVQAAHEYADSEVAALRGKKCTNLDEVKAAVQFSDIKSDPYPKLWYDTRIDFERDCYVVYPPGGDRTSYELKTMTSGEAEAYAPGRHFLSHRGQCGVCSQLDDLAVYIHTRDLTSAVRSCTLRMIKPWTISCLKSLGFTEECTYIWFWNTANTKKTHANGGCFGVCVAHIFANNNVPVGTYNPCKPTTGAMQVELSNTEGASAGERLNSVTPQVNNVASRRDLCLPCVGWGCCKDCCLPSSAEEEGGLCGNTINGRPACSREQWENGEFRLNPCLQCDECRSGPVFQRVSGRTRRNSGIISAIGRPGVVEIVHNYG